MSFAPPDNKKKGAPPQSDPFGSLASLVTSMKSSMGVKEAPPVEPPQPKLTLKEIQEQQLQKQAAEQAAKKKKDELDAAKLLLQPHFDVDDAHAHNAHRKGNQVTKAEYEEQAELLAKITRGDTSIKFKQAGLVPTADETLHKQGTLKDMAKVLSTKTGRQVVGDLSNRADTTTIGPTANPHSLSNSAKAEDWQAAQMVLGGSKAEINFRPGFNKTKAMTGLPVDITSDTSLLHEMVHAHHMTDGMLMQGQYEEADLGHGHKDIGVRKEEYATVGLGAFAANPLTENAYRAEMEAIHAANPDEKAKYAKRTSYNA